MASKVNWQRGLSPEYLYDEIMYAMSMEDISAYKNLRTEMAAGKIFPKLAEDITAFMAGTLLLTTDLILDRAKKKERVKLFMNPELCDITEDLVFTEPYYDYKGRNVILDENRDFVKEKLYGDKELHANVGQLRDGFMNHAQALLHGDLHSGSIFVNQEGTKVIDPEFAFYGPMGYDIGNVIGNLFFAWANKFYTDSGNREFLVWIENTIGEVVDKVREKFNEKWDETVTFPLYTNEEFKKDYIEQVMSDSFGYAGTEIIRRIVGDSKVKEVTDVEDLTLRVPMERALIEIGIKLIKERAALRTGIDIRAVGTKYFC